jgi:endonuclease/exonuclease/phosphatase family metal-dependent hydrolase
MRVLSWNLYHGRDFPPDQALFTLRSRLLRMTERNASHVQVNRPLLDEFGGWLADREWDVALLQEAPPRWFRELARRTGSASARVLTSRNVLPPLQGLLADANPDLIASWEGGSNQLLVREPGRVVEQRDMTLARRPEARRMLWARVELPDGETVCFGNLHASAGLPKKATEEVLAAAAAAVKWSEDDPLVFGGDLNIRPARDPFAFVELRERHGLGEPTGPNAIDHLLARGLEAVEGPRRLAAEERELPQPDGRLLRLSDHAPVAGRWEVGSSPGTR